MKRKIIMINEDKCNGCGLCVTGCHEGALQIINGKAKLVSESYCDGLGACLPACPMDAIALEEREAAEFDEEAVKERMSQMQKQTENTHQPTPGFTCPGSAARTITHKEVVEVTSQPVARQSQLGQWPCQIKLVPTNAPYFNNANLLIAADCTAFAYANFHQEFMRNKITIIGCPKLDSVNYAEKLSAIISNNEIKSVTVLRMEVPCCGGIESATKQALQQSGKMIPWQVVTISTDGYILD